MSQLLRRSTIVVLALLALPAPGAAQNYPERVVRIVNPYPPGGSVDVMARILAQKLTDNLGQQFIVENRSGGGGNTGSEFGGQVGSRRLHAAVHRARTAHRQPDALQQAAVRSGQGFRPDCAVCGRADRADGASGRASQQRPGADRARQKAAGQDQFRLGGHRYDQSSLRRAVQEHGEDRHRPRALSRRGTGHERSGRRTRSDVLRSPAGQPAANQWREGARAGQCRSEAACGAREPADDRGAGPARLRRGLVGRLGGAGPYAGAGAGQAHRGGRQGDEIARYRRAHPRARLRAGHRLRQGFRDLHGGRDQEMGRGHPRIGRQGGLGTSGASFNSARRRDCARAGDARRATSSRRRGCARPAPRPSPAPAPRPAWRTPLAPRDR